MISIRLKEAQANLNLKQEEIVAVSGIPLDSYRKYEGGTSEPGTKTLAGLDKVGIRFTWLVSGEGEMFRTKPAEASCSMLQSQRNR